MLGTNGGGFFNANSAHPYENPTPLSNFADAGDLPDPGRAVLHLRPHGRRHAPGLGGAGGDDRAVRRGRGDRAMAASSRATRCWRRWASTRRQRAAGRAATWKARRCASASPLGLFATASPPPPPAARSMPCTTRSRRWAAWCRWSDAARRSGVRRRRHGPVRHAGVRHLAVFIAGLMIGRTPEYLGKKIEAAR
jgi:K+-transporting ATPase ATPase A chain